MMSEWYTQFDDSLWLRGDKGAEDEARFVQRALRLRKGQSVLDAPCGAGRISTPLARAGCVVTGIDLHKKFILVARRRFRREQLVGQFRSIDLRCVDFQEVFHGCVNWSGSFGFFDDNENLDVLRRLVRSLRPGGRLLIDQPNRERMLHNFLPRLRAGGALTIRSRWDVDRQRVESVWSLSRGGRKVRCRSSVRLYTVGQFEALFERAGLAVEAMFGSWDGAPYSRSSRRLVMLGRKG